MDWLRLIRAYWPVIAGVIGSLAALAVISSLKNSPLTAGLFDIALWVPVTGIGVSFVYAIWVTYRLVQAGRGEGLLCSRCGGPLGFEKLKPYSPHRTCLTCGQHVNERFYR